MILALFKHIILSSSNYPKDQIEMIKEIEAAHISHFDGLIFHGEIYPCVLLTQTIPHILTSTE